MTEMARNYQQLTVRKITEEPDMNREIVRLLLTKRLYVWKSVPKSYQWRAEYVEKNLLSCHLYLGLSSDLFPSGFPINIL
jgi:hypothetical protein